MIQKLIIIGESTVGKSCIVKRYTDGTFSEAFMSTVGADFKIKILELNHHKIKVQVWDTAGQEQFHSITKSYFRGAHGILLIFDVSNRVSFDRTKKWMDSIRDTSDDRVIIVLVGNKIDLEREISREEGIKQAESYQIPYFETSAKTGEGIEDVFMYLIQAIFKQKMSQPEEKSQSTKIYFENDSNGSSFCC